ncbi:unnamed protein product [Caenorhabditis angaria]|uniref:Uncharacterized protein n=1 Tax=Caenorhabditis angaria TaxID=860376 RepID=A0A9P1N8Y3_9PELO|nr:unnamed protein product [Caenorhabditis angaria]
MILYQSAVFCTGRYHRNTEITVQTRWNKKEMTMIIILYRFLKTKKEDYIMRDNSEVPIRSQGIARSEFYDLCLTKLADKIKWRIEDMRKTKDGDSRLRFHLGEFFRMHSAPPFRPIVIKLIESISPYIDEHFLYAICKTEELYKNCNMQVKRVCWKMNEELFFDEIRTKVNEYLKNKEDIICSIDPNQTNFFTKETTKSRRNWPQIPEIIAMIGKNDILYKVFMKYLRNQFNEVANFHLCSLKSEFTIAAHEKGIEDPLYTQHLQIKTVSLLRFSKKWKVMMKSSINEMSITRKKPDVMDGDQFGSS